MSLVRSMDVGSDNYVNKFESRNTAMQQRTTANMCEIKKHISDANISACHAGLLQGSCSAPPFKLMQTWARKSNVNNGQCLLT